MARGNIGGVFGKHHFWQKKETIDAERFCEIYYDYIKKRTYLTDVILRGRHKIQNFDRVLYLVDMFKKIPPRCKVSSSYPFCLIYDTETRKIYAVNVHIGQLNFDIEDSHFELTTSDFIEQKEQLLAGETELVNLTKGA